MKMKLKKYQQGGMNPNDILASFLETLPEEEQDQFVDEFQELSPEEQLEVIQAISQQMQQPQMQPESLPEYEDGGSPKNGDTKRATQKGKKMAVYMDGKWHNFGDSSMDDYRTHKSEKRKDAFYSRHKKNLQGDDSRSKAFRVYARKTWQEGGQPQPIPIEVEGEETVKLPTGELQRFEGPSHAEGGIPTILPEGAKIYSEHLKAPPEVVEVVLSKKTKKKYSYADLSKKFPTKPFEDKIKNPDTDEIEKQAAAIKLQNHNAMLETIFAAQEMDKTKFSKGKKLQQGGKVGEWSEMYWNPKVPKPIDNSKSSEWWLDSGRYGFMDIPMRTYEGSPSAYWTADPHNPDGSVNTEYIEKRNSSYDEGFPGLKNSKSNTGSKNSRNPASQYVPMWSSEYQEYMGNLMQTDRANVLLADPTLYGADLEENITADATIPSLQRSRGKRIYGEQDWEDEKLMSDFKTRHKEFFAQEENKNWDPKNPGDTKKFQEWHNEQAKKRNMDPYFNQRTGFSGVDDKFGQYTWSAPSVSSRTDDIKSLPTKQLRDWAAEISSKPTPTDWMKKKASEIGVPETTTSDVPADDKDYPGRKFGWDELGISRQLSGTIFDTLMAASDHLDIDAPQFRDNRKTPLFTRFVDFEDEDVNKMYNQSMMQIMNSNVPEQVKQSQIANLNAKLQEFQGKEDFARYQNYQQKLVGDTEKLQRYMDTNIDQHTADIESYRQKVGRINDLKNQFKAQKKARVVNPIRQYLDFVQQVDLQNQVYSDNFKMNPYTGKVKFFQSTQDPLKEQENAIRQYAQNPQNVVDLHNGAKMVITPYGTVLIDIEGRIQQMETPKQQTQDDSKKVALNLMGTNLG